MKNFPANFDSLNPAGSFGLSKSGDKFSVEITKTNKQVFKQVTNGGKDKRTAVVNKNKTVLYHSFPNKKK